MIKKHLHIVLLLVFLALGVGIWSLPKKPSKGVVNTESELQSKVKKAIALVQYGKQPMQGIGLLREVLQEDPQNQEALYHLGVFSVQSNQWSNGVERFDELYKLGKFSDFEDAYYYQALCYASLDSLDRAKIILEEGLEIAKDSSLKETLSQFRNTIINL
ncbi:MAG: tetratricopeptide repeat protein [Luteibaculum sp.]